MSDSSDSPKPGRFDSRIVQSSRVEIKPFQPKNLNGDGIRDYAEVKKSFGSLSSLDGGGNPDFNLHAASKAFLGVERQEKNHVESLVKAEVDARILELKQKAYQDGFEEGKKAGFLHAETEYRESVAPIHAEWIQFLSQADQIKKELFVANEALLIQLVFQIGKHVLLKEMSSDREYVKRLMIHVVEKLGAKENIKIKISRKDSENIENLKEFLKAEIPDLKNIQFEASDDLQLGGCKVETDLSRINASVENQLSSIEKSLGET